MKKIFLFVLLICLTSLAGVSHARGSGFYFGGGYQQPVNYTWKNRVGGTDKIKMLWPAFGGYMVGGYDFEKIEWFGLAFPASWSFLKLNKEEWVHLINVDGEAVFHLGNPESKLDPYLLGIVGFNFMTEGSVANSSQSFGPDVGAGFGLRWTLSEYAMAGSTHITNLSLVAEVPVRVMLFMNDYDISDSSTLPVISVPVRIGLTYSF